MAESTKTNIPPSLLPKGWKAKAANEFKISEAQVYAVAAGLRNNEEVFQYLLDVAEQKKQKNAQVEERLTALTK